MDAKDSICICGIFLQKFWDTFIDLTQIYTTRQRLAVMSTLSSRDVKRIRHWMSGVRPVFSFCLRLNISQQTYSVHRHSAFCPTDSFTASTERTVTPTLHSSASSDESISSSEHLPTHPVIAEMNTCLIQTTETTVKFTVHATFKTQIL